MIKILHFHYRGAWVQSLARELRSHMLHGMATKKKKCTRLNTENLQTEMYRNINLLLVLEHLPPLMVLIIDISVSSSFHWFFGIVI